jgi:hypothetical protein
VRRSGEGTHRAARRRVACVRAERAPEVEGGNEGERPQEGEGELREGVRELFEGEERSIETSGRTKQGVTNRKRKEEGKRGREERGRREKKTARESERGKRHGRRRVMDDKQEAKQGGEAVFPSAASSSLSPAFPSPPP